MMTDSPYLSADASTVPATESQSRRLVSQWCELADVSESDFPLDCATAARVLAAAGYKIDEPELRRLMALGYAPDVLLFDGRDVLAVAGGCEARRQWRYGTVHDPKMHFTARVLEEHRAAGPNAVAALRKAKRADLTFLLVLMTECESREMREQLLTTIRLVLETDHGVHV